VHLQLVNDSCAPLPETWHVGVLFKPQFIISGFDASSTELVVNTLSFIDEHPIDRIDATSKTYLVIVVPPYW